MVLACSRGTKTDISYLKNKIGIAFNPKLLANKIKRETPIKRGFLLSDF